MTDTTPIATTENRLAAREAITAARAAVERLREDQPNNADVITTALDWGVVMTDVAGLLDEAKTEPEQLRERLASAARAIRKSVGEALSVFGANDTGTVQARVHDHHADVLSRLLHGPDNSLEGGAAKALAEWCQQLEWKDGDTHWEEVAKAAAYRQDIELLDKALRQPIPARSLSCQGLAYLDPTDPIHQGTVRVTGFVEEMARRGGLHVYGCELIGHIPETAAEQPRERPAEAAAADLLKAAEHLQEILGRYRTPSGPDHSGMAPPRVAGHIAHALELAAAAARELSNQGWIADYTEDTDTLAPHLPALEQATATYAQAVRELP